jgi:hypothetical protein
MSKDLKSRNLGSPGVIIVDPARPRSAIDAN